MKALIPALLMGAAMTLSACNKTEAPQQSETAEVVEWRALLNPNDLNAETLAAQFDFVSDETRAAWVDAQPFDNAMALHAFLMSYLDEDSIEKVYQTAFIPMDLNTTPEADFMIIPGVGKKMAHEFEEYRPYTSMDQFDREISKYVDANELARLRRYVTLSDN